MAMRPPRAPAKFAAVFCVAAVLLAGCAGAPPRPQPAPKPSLAPSSPVAKPKKPPPSPAPEPAPGSGVIAKSSDYVIVAAGPADTLASLAERHLGDGGKAWVIGDFNGISRARPGQEVVIPLTQENPAGIFPDGHQTVPVLCYHRFGEGRGKMIVSPAVFAEQMAFLAENGYRVVPLTSLVGFLRGREGLPRKTVVLTIDDGYRSSYQIAYPILKKHGFPATIFVYTDFVGARDALRWEEMREMVESGLIDLQPHSKTHANLAIRLAGEDDSAYTRRIGEEVTAPKRLLQDRLGLRVRTFAYPYGDANDLVIGELREAGIEIGVTVLAGGNPAFGFPYLLRRTMVLGDDDLEVFRSKLETFRKR
jgi:peptidoglycan/xylan/chitin deacetylase (PgdA/CDA1 family)